MQDIEIYLGHLSSKYKFLFESIFSKTIQDAFNNLSEIERNYILNHIYLCCEIKKNFLGLSEEDWRRTSKKFFATFDEEFLNHNKFENLSEEEKAEIEKMTLNSLEWFKPISKSRLNFSFNGDKINLISFEDLK